MKDYTTDILLNDFAIRSFRDTADRDYIHARLAFRAGLIPQFLWSSLHSLEKYSKAILLLNRIDATEKKQKHEVISLLQKINDNAKFEIRLSQTPVDFLNHIEKYAKYRYFEVSYYNMHNDLIRLDKTVSELRRYCQPLDYAVETSNGTLNLLEYNLKKINYVFENNLKETCITNGWLEKVIKNKKHISRESLLWQNLYFGLSRRKKINMRTYSESGNSPLYMHPEILEEVIKYVYLPKNIINDWREELKLKAKNTKPA